MRTTLLSACLMFAVSPLAADPIGDDVDELPLFDAHVHYNLRAWEAYPPGTVVEMMDEAGVAMALVSSSPDEGTIKLYEFAPNRVVPEMRPYHRRWGSSTWTRAPDMIDYIRKRLDTYPHVGIGEFHIQSIADEDDAFIEQVARLAAEKNVLVHIHSDDVPVEKFYGYEPGLTIIWAHAGMISPPEVIERMMDTYPTLYADLSYREHEIPGVDGLEPEWEHVLTKHADRFMVGSDTWINDQWKNYRGLILDNRRWLRHLPREIAEQIAYKNAERLFGITVTKDRIGTR